MHCGAHGIIGGGAIGGRGGVALQQCGGHAGGTQSFGQNIGQSVGYPAILCAICAILSMINLAFDFVAACCSGPICANVSGCGG